MDCGRKKSNNLGIFLCRKKEKQSYRCELSPKLGYRTAFICFFVCSKNCIIVRWNKQLISTVSEKYIYRGREIIGGREGERERESENSKWKKNIQNMWQMWTLRCCGRGFLCFVSNERVTQSWPLATVYIKTSQHNSTVYHIEIHPRPCIHTHKHICRGLLTIACPQHPFCFAML